MAMRIVELPYLAFRTPETMTVKESSPSKSDLAVYKNPDPSILTWPDCAGTMSFTFLITRSLKRNPRMQLWPLSIVIDQSTTSDVS